MQLAYMRKNVKLLDEAAATMNKNKEADDVSGSVVKPVVKPVMKPVMKPVNESVEKIKRRVLKRNSKTKQ